MVFTVKTEFEDKKDEARILFSHIDELSSESGNVKKLSILKSAYVLLLYNIIESTVTSVIGRIHEDICNHSYHDLSNKVRKIYIDYFFTKSSAKEHLKHVDDLVSGDLKLPELQVFRKKIGLFSGNLDTKEINILLSKYGIGEINEEGKEFFLIIKNKRNKIAHGEESFKESCREFSVNQLNSFTDGVSANLDKLIFISGNYLEMKLYLKKECRG